MLNVTVQADNDEEVRMIDRIRDEMAGVTIDSFEGDWRKR